jgi:hypothetical protein
LGDAFSALVRAQINRAEGYRLVRKLVRTRIEAWNKSYGFSLIVAQNECTALEVKEQSVGINPADTKVN